jgi:1,4-dihydroxy-2-naphthoyl-CoA hydrolase
MTLLEKVKARKLPFVEFLGIEFMSVEPEKLVAKMAVRPEFTGANDRIHGGVLMAFADTIGGFATFVNLPDGSNGTTTMESKTNFIRPTQTGAILIATATSLHKGRRTQVWTTRIEDDGRLVAVVTQTQIIL